MQEAHPVIMRAQAMREVLREAAGMFHRFAPIRVGRPVQWTCAHFGPRSTVGLLLQRGPRSLVPVVECGTPHFSRVHAVLDGGRFGCYTPGTVGDCRLVRVAMKGTVDDVVNSAMAATRMSNPFGHQAYCQQSSFLCYMEQPPLHRRHR